jgi:hypothetical protein
MPKMKTQTEISQEIDNCLKTIENFNKAYKEKKITKRVAQIETLQYAGMVLALKWVLGENDRWD